MNRQKFSWMLSLLMILGMALAGVRSASASQADPLPQIKNPSAAKFNITGSMTLGGSTLPGLDEPLPISGKGAISGNNYEMDLTVKVPQALSSGTQDLTTSQKLIDGKLYTKTSIPGGEDKWYVSDLGAAGGGTGSLTGLGPGLEGYYTVKMEGKEAVDGAPTTKYRIDIDLEKLLADSGASTSGLEGSTYMMYLWVGDADMYIHKLNVVMDLKSSSDDTTIQIKIDLAMTFYDFDVPVTITAPANAEPLDLGGNTTILGGMPSSVGGVMGGMPGMTSAGMPKSGAPHSDNTLLLALLALSTGLLVSGVAVRRKAPGRQRI